MARSKVSPPQSRQMCAIYDFMEVVGSGRYGVVWKAVQKKTGEVVAIKVIHMPEQEGGMAKAVANVSTTIEMVVAEVEMLKRLDHPNLLQLREVYRQGRTVFFVTELLDQSLMQAVAAQPYSEAEAKRALLGLCKGLGKLHAMRVVHRDVKPENVMVEAGDRTAAKIIDLGLAASTARGPLSAVCGSVPGVAPEVLRCRRDGSARYDERADVYSLGVLLFTMLTGSSPPTRAECGGLSLPLDACMGWATPAARDLVGRMLRSDPRARIGLAGVLCHPWMAPTTHSFTEEDSARMHLGGAAGGSGRRRQHLAHPPVGSRERGGLISARGGAWSDRRGSRGANSFGPPLNRPRTPRRVSMVMT